jgi:hypothetical protein
VCCAVAAHAALRVPADEVASLRKPCHPLTGEPLAPALLKNSDDQSVTALAAVSAAVRDHGLAGRDFRGWGVIAAPRFLGRGMMGGVLHRFRQEGAWGISPHLIPHRSLHAVSGTLSQALKIQGPNFGVGGGPGAETEALIVAATLVGNRGLPGVWVVLTGYDPEMAPTDPTANEPPVPVPPCSGVALALTALQRGGRGLQIRLSAAVAQASPSTEATEDGNVCPAGGWQGLPLLTLDALRQGLAGGAGAWRLSCGGWAQLTRVGTENCL